MRNAIKAIGFATTMALLAPQLTGLALGGEKSASSVKPPKGFDGKNAISHLKAHQKYPATKAELVASCKNLMDFSDEDKKWFAENLPEGTYKSADEVIKTLGLSSK